MTLSYQPDTVALSVQDDGHGFTPEILLGRQVSDDPWSGWGLLGMREDRFLHTANTDEPDPEARFEIVIGRPKEMRYRIVQVNAFGFGGQNASLIVQFVTV